MGGNFGLGWNLMVTAETYGANGDCTLCWNQTIAVSLPTTYTIIGKANHSRQPVPSMERMVRKKTRL